MEGRRSAILHRGVSKLSAEFLPGFPLEMSARVQPPPRTQTHTRRAGGTRSLRGDTAAALKRPVNKERATRFIMEFSTYFLHLHFKSHLRRAYAEHAGTQRRRIFERKIELLGINAIRDRLHRRRSHRRPRTVGADSPPPTVSSFPVRPSHD